MSSIGGPDPVHLNLLKRDLVPSSDLEAKELKIKLSVNSDQSGAESRDKQALVNQLEDDNFAEEEKSDLEKSVDLVDQASKGGDLVDVQKNNEQQEHCESYLYETNFKETSLDDSKDVFYDTDLNKELLDGYMGESVEKFIVDYGPDYGEAVSITEEEYYGQDTVENSDRFEEDETIGQRCSPLGIFEESEFIVESEIDLKDSLKEKILKRKESLKKNLTESKDTKKKKVPTATLR